jgi:hypothetical protein
MNSKIKSLLRPYRTACILLLAGFCTAIASAEPADGAQLRPAPQNSPLGQQLLEPLGHPLNKGRILYDARLRYEHADQRGLDKSDAFTLRQRFGYETPRFNGFYALAEGEYTWVLNNGDFGAYPPPFNNGQTVIPDAESFALNRLFLGYTGEGFAFKGGRQDINLGNQRYVGAVGWRQNNQTFDAVRLTVDAIPDLTLDYTWNWQVNRIFGTKAPTTPLRRFRADNHFFNALYSGVENVDFGGYAYSLRLRNSQALSSDTFGLFADGKHALNSDYTLLYRAEYAYQTDNSNTVGAGYSESYLHLRLGAQRSGYQLGGGFESLGGDGTRAFQTPLATLHAFNGWADTFLNTPADGLRDYYLWLSGPVAGGVNGRLEAHYFTGENNSNTYGHEFGLVLNKRINTNLTALVKGSYYNGRNGAGGAIAANKTKFWAQLDFAL